MFRRKQRFTIKSAGFVLAVNMRLLSRTISAALMYLCWVKFHVEKLENACKKIAKLLTNKHCVFLPNAAIFNPGKKFDQGRFWSRARQPLLSRERASRNQQKTLKIVIFVKFHLTCDLTTWLPLSWKYNFPSQNCYQQLSRRTTCLGPCPWGK